jgi:periplasmic nitrate reductase NapD
MNIAGILIHSYPGQASAVRAALAAIDGLEVHHETEDGRFIVTVEDAGEMRAGDTVVALYAIPSVASAALAYHSFEPDDPDSGAGPAALPARPTPGA